MLVWFFVALNTLANSSTQSQTDLEKRRSLVKSSLSTCGSAVDESILTGQIDALLNDFCENGSSRLVQQIRNIRETLSTSSNETVLAIQKHAIDNINQRKNLLSKMLSPSGNISHVATILNSRIQTLQADLRKIRTGRRTQILADLFVDTPAIGDDTKILYDQFLRSFDQLSADVIGSLLHTPSLSAKSKIPISTDSLKKMKNGQFEFPPLNFVNASDVHLGLNEAIQILDAEKNKLGQFKNNTELMAHLIKTAPGSVAMVLLADPSRAKDVCAGLGYIGLQEDKKKTIVEASDRFLMVSSLVLLPIGLGAGGLTLYAANTASIAGRTAMGARALAASQTAARTGRLAAGAGTVLGAVESAYRGQQYRTAKAEMAGLRAGLIARFSETDGKLILRANQASTNLDEAWSELSLAGISTAIDLGALQAFVLAGRAVTSIERVEKIASTFRRWAKLPELEKVRLKNQLEILNQAAAKNGVPAYDTVNFLFRYYSGGDTLAIRAMSELPPKDLATVQKLIQDCIANSSACEKATHTVDRLIRLGNDVPPSRRLNMVGEPPIGDGLNRALKENEQIALRSSVSNQYLSGTVVRENPTQITIRDSLTGRILTIEKSELHPGQHIVVGESVNFKTASGDEISGTLVGWNDREFTVTLNNGTTRTFNRRQFDVDYALSRSLQSTAPQIIELYGYRYRGQKRDSMGAMMIFEDPNFEPGVWSGDRSFEIASIFTGNTRMVEDTVSPQFARYLGFSELPGNRYSVPTPERLNRAWDTYARQYPEDTPGIRFYAAAPGRVSNLEYVRRFVNSGELPIATGGDELLHDLNVHGGMMLLPRTVVQATQNLIGQRLKEIESQLQRGVPLSQVQSDINALSDQIDAYTGSNVGAFLNNNEDTLLSVMAEVAGMQPDDLAQLLRERIARLNSRTPQIR